MEVDYEYQEEFRRKQAKDERIEHVQYFCKVCKQLCGSTNICGDCAERQNGW